MPERIAFASQSPLYNPDASTKDTAVFCRIVALRPTDGRTAQYLYPLEDPGNVVSELCALGGGDLLVLERDAEFPAEGRGFKKVFRIDLSQASDISPLDGYMAVDTLAPGRLAGYGLRAVEKELFCDILAAAPGYPHDKPEGMC
ncbi:MAG: esterase-like activity of phytase family protein, partial [Alistipes inops]